MLTQGTILFSKVKQRCITVKVYCIKIPQMLKKKRQISYFTVKQQETDSSCAEMKWLNPVL